MGNKYLEKVAAYFKEDTHKLRVPGADGELVLNTTEYKDVLNKSADKSKFRIGKALIGGGIGAAAGGVLGGALLGKPGVVLGATYGTLVGGTRDYVKQINQHRNKEISSIYQKLKDKQDKNQD